MCLRFEPASSVAFGDWCSTLTRGDPNRIQADQIFFARLRESDFFLRGDIVKDSLVRTKHACLAATCGRGAQHLRQSNGQRVIGRMISSSLHETEVFKDSSVKYDEFSAFLVT